MGIVKILDTHSMLIVKTRMRVWFSGSTCPLKEFGYSWVMVLTEQVLLYIIFSHNYKWVLLAISWIKEPASAATSSFVESTSEVKIEYLGPRIVSCPLLRGFFIGGSTVYLLECKPLPLSQCFNLNNNYLKRADWNMKCISCEMRNWKCESL